MGRKTQHRFHGDPQRFDVLADYIADTYGRSVDYIADVAGGQGMLSRILNKHYRYHSEVIDPRGCALVGIPSRAEEFTPALAGYYDLIVGLHPDEATRAVAEAALVKPAIVIPCCNFWSDEKLGRDELVDALAEYYSAHGVEFERVTFNFKGPKNIGLVSRLR
jgi:hypothetical protein